MAFGCSFPRILIYTTFLLIPGAFSGCGGETELPQAFSNLVPISGTITLNGKPLANAAVTFIPTGQDAMRKAYGKTDENGKYELMTPVRGRNMEENQGAIPGQYRVMINKLVMPDGSELPEDTTHADAMSEGAHESLSLIYSDPERSRLTAEVAKAGEQPVEINFELKSK